MSQVNIMIGVDEKAAKKDNTGSTIENASQCLRREAELEAIKNIDSKS